MITKDDRRLLLQFAKSTLVERFYMLNKPDWVITNIGEANRILSMLKEANPKFQAIGSAYASKVTGVDPKSLEGALIASHFINPRNNYDDVGIYRNTIAYALYLREPEKDFFGAATTWEPVRKLLSQDTMATILTRFTASSLYGAIAQWHQGRTRAIAAIS